MLAIGTPYAWYVPVWLSEFESASEDSGVPVL